MRPMMASAHSSDSAPAPASREAAEYLVLTPERVGLRYDIAGVGSRSAAALIDSGCQALAGLLLGVLTVCVLFVIGMLRGLGVPPGSVRGGTEVYGWVALALLLLGSFLVLWGYYLVFEIAWNGQTPGKRVLGLRVIREN